MASSPSAAPWTNHRGRRRTASREARVWRSSSTIRMLAIAGCRRRRTRKLQTAFQFFMTVRARLIDAGLAVEAASSLAGCVYVVVAGGLGVRFRGVLGAASATGAAGGGT